MAGSSGSVRAGKAYVEFDAHTGPLNRAIAGMSAMVTSGMAGLASALSSVAAVVTVGVAAAGAAVAAISSKFAAAGSSLHYMAGRTGASVEALSVLKYGADQTGASIEDVERSMRRMQDALASAASGGTAANNALASLGLSIGQLQGLKPEQQMEQIFASLSRVADASQQTAIAIDLFGRSGTAMLPLAGEFQSLRAQAEQLGLVMSEKDAAAAARLGDSFDMLKASIAGLINRIGAAITGPFAGMVEAMSRMVAGVTHWVAANQDAIVGFVDGFVRVAKDGYAALSFAVGNWSDISALAVVSVVHGVVSFGNQLKYTFTEVMPAYLAYMLDNWRNVFDNIWRYTKTVTANVFKNLKRFGESIADWFVSGEWTFEWTALTNGFESTLAELPKIAAREIVGLEKELADDIARLSGSIGQKWAHEWDKHQLDLPKPEQPKASAKSSPLINAIDSAAKTSISSVGTFTAGAIGQIAPPEFASIRDATRETARNTRDMKEDIARIAEREGLTFA